MPEKLFVLQTGAPFEEATAGGARSWVTAPGGCTFAVVRLEDGGYGIDDVEEARLVDELHGDFTPFVVTVDDAPHVIVAGVSRAEQVLVERADEVARLCHVKNGVWLSAPVPFTPGMRITATRRDKDGA